MSEATLTDEVLAELRAGLSQSLQGFSIDSGVDPNEIATRMLAAVPRAHYNELIGPCYSTEAIAWIFGASLQAVADRVERGRSCNCAPPMGY